MGMGKKGSILIAIGLLLLAAALLLTLYNIWDAHRADVAAQTAVRALKEMIPKPGTEPAREHGTVSPEPVLPDSRKQTGEGSQRESEGQTGEEADAKFRAQTGMKSNGEGLIKSSRPSPERSKSKTRGNIPQSVPEKTEAQTETEDGFKESSKRLTINNFFPDATREREMPRKNLNGYPYIGVLDVDSLELSLPVMDNWDYDRLTISPCRFAGNVYQDNLVICAHNYAHHFTPLKYVPIGTEIKFTDMEGTTFRYAVSSFETIGPNDVEGMITGDWDLTLFTCNTSGQTRCAIRCLRIE